MIEFDEKAGRWFLRNKYATYAIGLKDNQIHHLFYLPNGLADKYEADSIMKRELQPEAEVHINNEARNKHHGACFTGCSASSRAQYQGFEIIKNADNATETLVLSSIDNISGLEINHYYIVYGNSPAITRYVAVKNRSKRPVGIQHLGSFALYGIPFFADHIPGREVKIHTFPSSWCWEGQMRTITAEEAGIFNKYSLGCWHVESTGSWTCKEYIPFFILEETAEKVFWCMQIEHSGSWRFELGGSCFEEAGIHVQGGIGNYTYAHWYKTLLPGEEFISARASLACIQGEVQEAMNLMQEHRRNILIKRSNSDKSFPVIFNEWNSTQGAVREETVHKHLEALKGLGTEVYAIDAGWYFKYSEDMKPGDWFLNAGDWEAHPSRFPNGIKAIADKIVENGMIPGIWIEIEIAAVKSASYNKNVHLFMKNGSGFVEDNSHRFLYFGSTETREYATRVFEKIIEAGFRYFKIDYNVDCGLGCDNSGDSLGQGLIDHVRGYYQWLDDLKTKHPEIIVENCSSGGNRLDYGLLAHTDLSSITDQSEWSRLSCVFYGVSKYIHPSQMGNWSILKDDTEDRVFIFTLINSMMGRMHVSGEVEKLSLTKRQILMDALAFYKKWRDIMDYVQLFHHTQEVSLQYLEGWLVLQMNDQKASRILLGAWRLKSDIPVYIAKLKKVDFSFEYIVTSFPDKGRSLINGGELEKGFALHLDNQFSAVIYAFEKRQG